MKIFDMIDKMTKEDAYTKHYEKRAHRYRRDEYSDELRDIELKIKQAKLDEKLIDARSKRLAKLDKNIERLQRNRS